jgi:hypothetical protein
MLGLFTELTLKFVKRYRRLGDEIGAAAREYAEEVRQGRFRAAEHMLGHSGAQLTAKYGHVVSDAAPLAANAIAGKLFDDLRDIEGIVPVGPRLRFRHHLNEERPAREVAGLDLLAKELGSH